MFERLALFSLLLFVAGCNPRPAVIDGRRCDEAGACVSGYVCEPATWICVSKLAPRCTEGDPCDTGDPCLDGICKGDVCVGQARADGTLCDDGAYCTVADVCKGGVCTGYARDCSAAAGACSTGVCREATDLCETQRVVDGTPCDDGVFCTVDAFCTQGVCGGGGARDCAVAVEDQCNGSICDVSSDACLAVPVSDGVLCDDGDACTTADRCSAGLCEGTAVPLCDWLYQKQITLHAAYVAGDLGNFPVLIDLAADLDLAAHAQDSGDDLVFLDATGQRLAHEIERFDGVTGRLLAWVQVSKLSSTSDTILTLHYGNGNTTRQENTAGVWDQNYLGVWHLQEDASGTSNPGLYRDSTAGGHHGDDFVSATGKEGKIGAGQAFDGVDDFINCGNDPGLDLDYLTLAFWFRDTRWVDNGGVISRGTDTARRYWVWTWGNDVSMEVDGDGSHNRAWSVASGQWVHLVLTYDGTEVRTYRDGVLENTYAQATGPIDTTSDPLLFGEIPGFNHFGGTLDEVRLSRKARTPEWIQTAYANQSAPGTFVTLGPEQ